MNTYTITIETVNDTVVHEIEALAASVNVNEGTIEAATGDGKFSVIRIPEDWVRIDADQELDPELIAQAEAAEAVPPPMAAPFPSGAVPPPVATAPPGQ